MMKYTQLEKDIYTGFCNLQITDVIREYPDFFRGFSVLITCLDSSSNVASLSKWMSHIKENFSSFEIIGEKVLIHKSEVERLILDQKTFFGFDEVYLVKKSILDPIKFGEQLTTGMFNFKEKVSPLFVSNFRSIEAIRYLADGCGLNFACESPEIAEKLINLEKRLS